MNEVASGIIYCGLIILLAGFVSMIRPIRRLGIMSRRRAVIVSAAGMLLFVAGSGPEQKAVSVFILLRPSRL